VKIPSTISSGIVRLKKNRENPQHNKQWDCAPEEKPWKSPAQYVVSFRHSNHVPFVYDKGVLTNSPVHSEVLCGYDNGTSLRHILWMRHALHIWSVVHLSTSARQRLHFGLIYSQFGVDTFDVNNLI
jgi:hypothetical protein